MRTFSGNSLLIMDRLNETISHFFAEKYRCHGQKLRLRWRAWTHNPVATVLPVRASMSVSRTPK